MPIEIPRDRESNFEPQIISKMHSGNLSFVSEQGRPYDIAPAYDMTPMTFAPRSGGGLQSTMSVASICAGVTNETWRYAEQLARVFLAQMKTSTGFSHRFESCIAALENHIKMAGAKLTGLDECLETFVRHDPRVITQYSDPLNVSGFPGRTGSQKTTRES